MSYYSWVNLQYTDGDKKIDVAEFVDGFKDYLDECSIHHDVIEDISTLFTSGEAMIKLYGEMIDDIMLWVSTQRPRIGFGAQGRGEELRDVWVREYARGETTFTQGPFE